ncbi:MULTISPECIES: EutP/PduV family microcompartment system protein [unclassified Granulicatella]|uniref:EutP/PduV family microcompartment system protein n=1 Tax=unclassified Granulicatella TaxID=2630493 RepID=UPI0010731425|nr:MULTISPECIES: EutP/PduV family microcompartment system protein [unclassified Granulicatella]MBF0779544.1 EutP/PduV family microcompartment system protein [Granulicatella sp. 19428wC4_WM01]TFU96508.1 EutP/PduV family microcompartment system protein [Granulicatella sp. WM01]
MKKVMFVGAVGVGKTTLTQRLKGVDISYHKTQAIQFHQEIIDTPGEFLQHREFYQALMVTSAEADVVGLLLAATEKQQIFPAGFVSLFNKPVIGVITKMDLLEEGGERRLAMLENQLRSAGAKEIFKISSVENQGIQALRQYLGADDVE